MKRQNEEILKRLSKSKRFRSALSDAGHSDCDGVEPHGVSEAEPERGEVDEPQQNKRK